MKRLVFLDIQHAGKPPAKMSDRGAAADLNHNGITEISEAEARWTAVIAFHLEGHLLSAGYQVITLSDGWYKDRHARVNDYAGQAGELGYARSVYLALHLNSLHGGQPSDSSGTYSSFFYHHGTTQGNGDLLAQGIAESMKDQLAEWYAMPDSELSYHTDPATLHKQKPDARAIAAWPTGWTKNAFYTIKGVGQSVAICAEPYFLDQIMHPISEGGMKRAARALFEGIHGWFLYKEQTS